MPTWAPVVGLLLGAVATIVAARLNTRPAERNAGLSILQAGLAEQRVMLDRERDDRAEDRAAHTRQIEELHRRSERERADCDRKLTVMSEQIADLRRDLADIRGDRP